MAGIYLHIPFCKKACNYCDFHFSTILGNKEAVVSAIIKEIDLRQAYLKKELPVESIYFGGGTPSLLSATDIERIFTALNEYFQWDRNAEITLEANPDDINIESLRTWKAAGINRLSIGLQSFNDEELKWMNRAHTAEESLASVKLAQDEGFDNISIDLIYGSKFQTISSWEKTLATAIKLNTTHISSYNLTIENKTRLGVGLKKGLEPQINDELSGQQFLLMGNMLEAAGFIHYEISNFAKQGFIAKHNSNYWLQQPYLGLGPSAHSFDGATRQWNVKNNSLYVKALNEGSQFFEKEELSLKDRYNEYVLTRLRTIWGCDANEMAILFGENTLEHFKRSIEKYLVFVKEENGVYTLTKEGRLQADGIASDLFIL